MRTVLLVLMGCLLVCCSSQPKPAPAEAAQKAEAPKPTDETRRFPLADRVDTRVVDTELLGKPFMPGGTLANYKKGKTEYSMFVAKLPAPDDAALLLLDWNKALAGAQLVPSFGGYFGRDDGRPVFVFAKGAWIAGVVGLDEKQADGQARLLAAHLN